MDRISTTARLRALVLGGALIGVLAVPAAVSADTPPIYPPASNGGTITVNAVHILSKVVADVDASFICDPFEFDDWQTGEHVVSTVGHLEGGDATLVQAAGQKIVTGTAPVSGGLVPIVCDSHTVNHLSYEIVASNAPWKNGAAVLGVTAYGVDDRFQEADYASSGPVEVKLSNK